MGRFLSELVLPLLLLTAAGLNWSLISLFDLLAFLFILFMDPKAGFQYRNQSLTSWRIFIFSLLVMFSHAVFNIVSEVGGDQWTILVDSQWAKLIGFVRIRSGKFPSVIYFLALQLFVALVALAEFHSSRVCLPPRRGSCLGHLFSSIEHLGSHFRVVRCLFLPAVQLVAGISHPTWTSLPFFICSCIGLVDWSLTSNFLGLFRWSRYLLLYSGLNIVLLYVYQLPIEFSDIFVWIADFIGLYKISSKSEWSEISSCVSLLLFYFTLCSIRCDLSEMDFLMSTRESNLTEQLLPSKHSFFIHQSRSGVRHTNVLLRGAVFRTFSINFFIYGFPISLFALSSWSFHFASVCAFGLLGYVGYILFAFPPMFNLHRLNGLLLVFILLWAASTYIFNVAFTDLNRKLEDTEIWETIGLWHYPIPGFYLLAQFCLGILVAMGNLVNNSVFLYLSDGDRQSTHDDCTIEEKEEPKVLIVATVAWGLRKSSRAIVMALIFPIAMKPGFVHAAYMVYFMMYLLSHTISRRLRQSLILLCEVHFALLYILRLNLVSKLLEKEGSLVVKILSVLGLLDEANSEDYFKIVVLACFCAIHNHGFDILFSFSAVVQHAPCPPVGFSILRAGLTKSVLLSVYTSKSRESHSTNSSHERRITLYLGTIGQKFLSAYRSCGTYIAFLTILLTVYLVTPNYTSFGYLFFLLLWMVGRQLVGKTRKRLWLPLKLYAVAVFILIYCLSVFFTFEKHLSTVVDLYTAFGFDPKAPILKNVWESLAVLIVMQLYSYERRQSKYFRSGDQAETTLGKFAFSKRLLILHSEKILFVALLYASLHPISAFGFLYLLGLVICSALSKTSRVPSKMFLVYSGFLLMVDYLFQMLGHQVEMFPGEKNSYISRFLGLQVFAPGFQGLESGLRGKVLVIVACILRYNVFYWLGKMTGEFEGGGNMEEPCALFDPADKPTSEVSTHGSQAPTDASPLLGKHKEVRSNIWPFLNLNKSKGLDTMSSETGYTEGNNMHKYIYRYIWGSPTDSQKWNKKRFFVLKKERLEMQKMTLKIHMKFWIENMFNIFGLEINMIGLLVASFAVLNAISLLYIASLAACILLQRHVIQKIWPIFVCSFASVLTLEYLAIWLHQMSWEQVPSQEKAHCHDCWRSAYLNFEHCKRCWLGITVDDPRMLISYYMVFMLACFKLRSDNLCNISWPHMYRQMLFQCKNATVQSDLSFETKGMWTFLDYLRLYSYCHLLDLVLALILITGTLEYDILHLGYLGFALVFFRIRLEILKTRNKIFRLLRMYNFALIVFSLAYQSPFVGDLDERKCQTIDYIFEVTGFYKYDYGFRITSRSALVEIIIFMLVSLQSYMFSSQEFDYVYKYLEAEQIGAIVCEQEKRAAWKTEQLQRIRKSEEQKCLRNLQVEKMKSEMLNLQSQLHSTSTVAACGNASPESENLRKRRNSLPNTYENSAPYKKETDFKKQAMGPDNINPSDSDMNESLMGVRKRTQMVVEKTSSDEEHKQDDKIYSIEHPLISAVHLIGDGVSQVQCLGNLAVNNIVTFLNIENEEANSNDHCSGAGVYNEIECVNMGSEPLEETLSMRSVSERAMSDVACLQISLIFRYIWAQIRSNNDVVCYCCFVLIFLWNFSLLSMVYLGALFLYALCVNTGPSYMFWIVILIYTEAYILSQYLYQIIIQHCKFRIHFSFLHELGFPPHKITSSFVISNWPLFLVYLFTLLQSSITARDGEWASITLRRRHSSKEETIGSFSCRERIQRLLEPIKNMVKLLTRSLCKYWKSLKNGAETPPYFLQLSMEVKLWPEDGIQPERIESGINKILNIIYDMSYQEMNPNHLNSASRVRVQSIERSPESPNMALAVFEVVYAAPSNQSTPLEWYESLTPAADVANEIIKAQRAGIFRQIGFPFPILSVIGGGRKEVDLYAYMFGADLAVSFLVAIFYQSVIKNKSEFLEVYQLEDQFPKEFVFILMIIFFLIVLDRVIYLCSFATGKVIFYLFNLVLFTFSVTKYAWYMEPQHQRAGRFALRAIYLTKAISLALQAIQIRYGVPHKSTLYRQFLTSSVSQINFLGFRVYRALPFLYELRCVLDWSCTTTSLSMYDWLKLEDIHASLFLVKCDANLNRARHRQGEKQTRMTKLCNGICLFFILICVIWAPMLMYSSGNPTNIANPIKDANVHIDVKTAGGRLTLFETTLCEKLSWDELNAHINLDPKGYLSSYNEQDIQLICCQADASTLWQLPFVVQARFTRTIEYSMDIIFSWQFTRDRPKSKEVVKYEVFVQDQDLPRQSDVMKVLNGTTNSFGIHNIYPRYFRVTGSGDVRFLEREVDLVSGDLVLNRGNPEWWSFHDYNASDMSACGEFGGPMAIVVSEETPQGILGETLSKFSIWGLYITFVLAVGRFIRLQCSDLRMRIPYENLPSCDRLLAICEDIYAARAEGELEVEEVLYWTLVKIYRSPHMLLEYTKPD